ncbi:acetaldehyde dehydrogenase (acetylating) [Limnochorda pilosa]|uniref:Acetaldehyde dehydrogenase n=1 Tax=Limnochorda pilosa TaxID=1555112 RepID=A0A0K2SLL9_LIMPI|nr:acetaldehyde dehydrogenase (acetylating) [Limnochorda pilosa]BAS28013.1 acetaldehyde dehydrogenase [Limnochorda pilosa]
MGERLAVAIVGSGNIGTDLLYKLLRSESLRPVAMAGIDPESEGLARARSAGLWTTVHGARGLLEEGPRVALAFDATSARAHVEHAPFFREAGVRLVDLTPARLGPPVVPVVNMEGSLDAPEINLTTCGGQATIPMVAAIRRVSPVAYAEIVATIASRSAGPGTRQNIDEFTRTTSRGLEEIGGAGRGKAIIILNPAEPPIMMRDTVYARVAAADLAAIRESVREMEREVQRYVPGYRVKADPVVDGDRVTLFIEVEGAGDFLPPYAGNLDIMTSAAVRVGEELAPRLHAAA